MFKSLKLKLTLICTLITGIILCIMAFAALYVSESQLKIQQDQAFNVLFENVVNYLETEQVIQYDWLVQTERANQCTLFIQDNNVPLSFRGAYLPEDVRSELIQSAYKTYLSQGKLSNNTYILNLGLKERFIYSVKEIPKPTSTLSVLLIKDQHLMMKQMLSQRVTFLFLILLGEILLFLFSWWFVGKTLSPIEIARKKQNDFIASASHELRSPIAVIKATLAAIEVGTPKEQAKFIDIANTEANHMAKLLNDLLLLANFDQNHIQKELIDLDSYTFLLNLFEKYEGIAKIKGQTLRLLLPQEECPNILCDEHRLNQLFSILLDNALTYTPEKSCITLFLKTQKHQILMGVMDNGKGISAEDKEKIFERFYRVDKAHSKKEHSGLGLSIGREIANRYNWGLTVSDTPGGGTTFTIHIPL